MKTAFVTGSTGFVGLNLVEALLDAGWRVVALHRPSSNLKYLSRFGAERASGDVTDPDSLRAALPEGADAVFHVAGNVNLWSRRNNGQTRDNVDGTRNVVTAALERGARRFVYTSSIAAYGMHPLPIDESTPTVAPQSWVNYLRTKAAAEQEVRRGIDSGLDAVILNPAHIVGPYDKGNWSRMLYLVHYGTLPGVPGGRGSFCHVREVVRAHLNAIEHGRTGENYLLGGVDADYVDVVRICGEITSRKVPHRPTPAILLWLLARAMALQTAFTKKRPSVTPEIAHLMGRRWVCRSDKAIRELDYRTVSVREMFEDCYRWLVAEGRLKHARDVSPKPVQTVSD
jgi:nucleoside-diphosphate-sugar epimerase